jgi:hypothetical protein
MSTSAWTAAEGPPTLLQCVDQVCDAFEAAWKAAADGSPRPRIEDYLADAPEAARADLLRELLVLDVTYRRRVAETPTPDGYRQQFPDQAALIAEVFRRAGDGTPTAVAPTLVRVAVLTGAPTAAGASGTPTTVGKAPAARPEWPHIPRYEILDELDAGGMGWCTGPGTCAWTGRWRSR